MQRRKASRNKMWKETTATGLVYEHADFNQRKLVKLIGAVDNLGAKGLFLRTKVAVPVHSKLSLDIQFRSGDIIGPSIKAKGVVVRQDTEGLAIQFTAINASELGECIMQMLNQVE